MPAGDAAQFICFGPFALDLRAGELRRSGIRLPLQGRPLQVLVILLRTPGEVVTSEQLRTELWPADTFVDFEHGVHNAVARLRAVLGDTAENPRFIGTLPRKGYRFIGTVEPPPAAPNLNQDGPASGREAVHPIVERPAEVATVSGRRSRLRALPFAFLACGFVGALVVGLQVGDLRERFLGLPGGAPIRSIAVLPLENLSRDPEQEYFASGMAEALTTELAQISTLNVISRTSAMQYKGTKKSLPQIAHELGVDAVVEGAVQRAGDKVEITVQLIRAPSDRHLWAKSYVRATSDLLELQHQVAKAIIDEIRAKLTPADKARLATVPQVNSAAYEDYLRGRFEHHASKSIVYFERAIQKDPNYALAYAGLAESYISLGQPGSNSLPPRVALPQAKWAATKALGIDDSLAEAHSALAHVLELSNWDWQGAEKEYRRALGLDPNSATAHAWYGEYLQAMGRNEEALLQTRQAMALDPLSAENLNQLGYIFYTARQYDKAIPAFQKALEQERTFVDAHVGLGWVYGEKKMYSEAIAELEKLVNLSDRNEVPVASLGNVLGYAGRGQDARKLLAELEQRSRRSYISPYLIALIHLGLGERDQAIASLEQGYTNRDQWMMYLKVDPHLDDLRFDARFHDLVRRVGLSQ